MSVSQATAASERFNEFETIAIDRSTIPATQLNLDGRTRTSTLPWRGQFSPELISNLLKRFAPSRSKVLDPFAGSGTTLIECGRNETCGIGFDVNPAAVYAARTAELMCLSKDIRAEVISRISRIIEQAIGPFSEPNLLSPRRQAANTTVPREVLKELLVSADTRPARTILLNVLMQAFGSTGTAATGDSLLDSLARYTSAIRNFPYTTVPLRCDQGDARGLGLEDSCVDLVLTSPPYVNVFNYHQNFRTIVELVGHDPLGVAKTEIGSNRKHRQNRFLTVTQYCLDMQLALHEIRRVIAGTGKVIVVVGRESNVLGQRFENGRAIYALAGGCGLSLERRLERVFVSRFGPRVYEEILVFVPSDNVLARPNQDEARDVARCMLSLARSACTQQTVREAVDAALVSLDNVSPSPSLVDSVTC